MVAKKDENTQVVVKEKTFTKDQLLKSEMYSNRRDALNALLKDDEAYTISQVDEILEKFYKG